MTRREFAALAGAAVASLYVNGIAAPVDDAPTLTTWANTPIRVGDVFTIQGWFEFDPASRRRTDKLQEFRITSATTGFAEFAPT